MKNNNSLEKILDLTPRHLAVHQMQGKNNPYLIWHKVQGAWFASSSIAELFELEQLPVNCIAVTAEGIAFEPFMKNNTVTWKQLTDEEFEEITHD